MSLSPTSTSLHFVTKLRPNQEVEARRTFPFVRAVADGGNGKKLEDDDNKVDNRSNSGRSGVDLKRERQRPAGFNLRWRDLLSPDPDNAFGRRLDWPPRCPRVLLHRRSPLNGDEFLPDSGSFLDLSHEIGRDVVFRELIMDMSYFVCPSLPLIGRELSPPISSRPAEAQKEELVGESKHASVVLPTAIPMDHHRHGLASQVFFEKPKDNEFVDMKVESPGGATLTHLEPEGKEEAKAKDDRKGEGRMRIGEFVEPEIGQPAGIGTFIFVFGGRQLQRQQQNQRIQFCSYAGDKLLLTP